MQLRIRKRRLSNEARSAECERCARRHRRHRPLQRRDRVRALLFSNCCCPNVEFVVGAVVAYDRFVTT
jgi:hypothetical protein